METTLLDQLILLLTGLSAVYLIFRFIQAIKGTSEKAKYFYHYIVSFAVLFVSGVLIILFDFAILARPEIKIVATLIPFTIATGLMCQFYQKYAKAYVMFLMLGFILIILLNYGTLDQTPPEITKVPIIINGIAILWKIPLNSSHRPTTKVIDTAIRVSMICK